MPRLLWPSTFGALMLLAGAAPAFENRSVEDIAAAARKSLAVISYEGRDGKREGLGTGFVVAADGLVATNRHVLGEGRPITVEIDGKKYEVITVHASDREADLAILRVAAKDLKPLPLGDSDRLKEGQAVVALGNPRGLTHSVVAGVVSAKQKIEGRTMIQIAMPIEPGNSGGPLLDMQGQVQGIVTLKSAVSANLGFAGMVNQLKPLLAKPNPVPMTAWLTIGQLDRDEWLTTGSARWHQRAGRVLVDGSGADFASRSLCLSKRPTPKLPYEIAVSVKMEDETGAAGLAFFADGGDRHYGFYPSNGQMRLTCFEGPTVFTWKVLRQDASPNYRPGEWNYLKVHLEKGRIRCYVNDHLMYDVEDEGFSGPQAGLAKFRDTVAEFKGFRVAEEIGPQRPKAETARRVDKLLANAPAGKANEEMIAKLAFDPAVSGDLLQAKARELERQAADLRQLAQAVQQRSVLADLSRIVNAKDDAIDLVHAALLLAKLDNNEVDIDAYRGEVDAMARKVSVSLPKDANEAAKLAALDRFLFKERGFHGSRSDYYNRANSHLSEVIDDREGLPITLSVLYMEIAGRLGVKVEGVGLPGHFVVRHVPAMGENSIIDVYEAGKRMTNAEALALASDFAGETVDEEVLKAVSKRAILVRMLTNLYGVAQKEGDAAGMLRYLEAMVILDSESARHRGMRALLRAQTGDKAGALKDVDWLIEKQPEGVDLDRLQDFRRKLMSRDQ
jgi:regulator of sirC expression with transglutaminase-like and TPR domain